MKVMSGTFGTIWWRQVYFELLLNFGPLKFPNSQSCIIGSNGARLCILHSRVQKKKNFGWICLGIHCGSSIVDRFEQASNTVARKNRGFETSLFWIYFNINITEAFPLVIFNVEQFLLSEIMKKVPEYNVLYLSSTVAGITNILNNILHIRSVLRFVSLVILFVIFWSIMKASYEITLDDSTRLKKYHLINATDNLCMNLTIEQHKVSTSHLICRCKSYVMRQCGSISALRHQSWLWVTFAWPILNTMIDNSGRPCWPNWFPTASRTIYPDILNNLHDNVSIIE